MSKHASTTPNPAIDEHWPPAIPSVRTEANVHYNAHVGAVERIEVFLDDAGSMLELMSRLGSGDEIRFGLETYGERAEGRDRCSLSVTRGQADTLGRMLIWLAAQPDPTPLYYAAGQLAEELRQVYELETAFTASSDAAGGGGGA